MSPDSLRQIVAAAKDPVAYFDALPEQVKTEWALRDPDSYHEASHICRHQQASRQVEEQLREFADEWAAARRRRRAVLLRRFTRRGRR